MLRGFDRTVDDPATLVRLCSIFSEGVHAVATGNISFFPDDEIRMLNRLAHASIIYLVVVSLASFFLGAYFLSVPAAMLVAQAFIGFSGSAVAALVSCLDRYAIGFEREDGKPFPEDAKVGEGKFTRRFARWLFVRPFLGALVAPVFIWGLSHFTNNPEGFTASDRSLGFTAFMAGLLAKSILELVKNLFKNVFKS
jgi:hypothetical protein